MGAKYIRLFTDSKLLASQFDDTYKAKCGRMNSDPDMVRTQAKQFMSSVIIQTPRAESWHADALAYLVGALAIEEPI